MGWTCSQCREEVDDGFEVCWSCGASVDGTPDPEFQRVAGAEEQPAEMDEFLQGLSEAEAERSCPECRAPMRPIRLLDSTGEYHSHEPLHYAAGDAQRGSFLGRFPTAGKVEAVMCAGCGRILLYGKRHR